MFPLKIFKFNINESETFNKYFAEENGEFHFEGMWFRNQRPENANQSGYENETTQRRRYIHFYNTYINENDNLAMKYAYMIVSNTMPKEENERYLNRILKALKKNSFTKFDDKTWMKENLKIIIEKFDNHPKNELCKASFPDNYNSVDVIAVTDGFDYQAHYERMWKHSTKLFRIPNKRENPKYISDIDEIKKYLPAQVEMGCGPSIAAGIDPLYEMHETYRVQNHLSKKFYYADDDDLMEKLIKDPIASYIKFSQTPKKCLQAQHTEGYKTFDRLYKKGLFVGTVYNNNFDRLVKRFDIPEIILRTYDINTYIQQIEFDKRAKSLICIGTHADRRQVQKQARAAGLQIIFIDPEGFYNDDGFISYPIEGPKDNDLILKTTFEDAMTKFESELL